jgi:hypothetical protein
VRALLVTVPYSISLNSTICTGGVVRRFVWLTAASYCAENIDWLVFVIGMQSVFGDLTNGILNNCSLQLLGLKGTAVCAVCIKYIKYGVLD